MKSPPSFAITSNFPSFSAAKHIDVRPRWTPNEIDIFDTKTKGKLVKLKTKFISIEIRRIYKSGAKDYLFCFDFK